MTNSYIVHRDGICVGKVITDFEFIGDSKDISGTMVKIGPHYKYRSMLFVKDINNCAIDLLYNSPRYPIFTPENIEECKNAKVIIDQAYNIKELLTAYDYSDEISYWGVEGIRKRFFNGKFPLEYADIFGMIPVDPATQTYYDSLGNPIYDKKILEQTIKEIRRSQYWSRSQAYIHDDDIPCGIKHLSQELFEVLREYGNHSLYDVLHEYEDRINAFKPHREEGLIRSRKNTTF